MKALSAADYRVGDRVRHTLMREEGEVIACENFEVHVRFDTKADGTRYGTGERWKAIYDHNWFNQHPHILQRILTTIPEPKTLLVLARDEEDATKAEVVGLKLIPVIKLINELFNGSEHPEKPEWGGMAIVWPRDGRERGRMMTNIDKPEELARNIRLQMQTMQSVLEQLERETGTRQ